MNGRPASDGERSMKALGRDPNASRRFDLIEMARPEPGPNQVRLRVAYAGICGSDLHIYHGHEAGLPQFVHGHEFSGTIDALGDGVDDFAVGERVTAEHTYRTCERCAYCRSGRYQLCPERESIGFDIQGGFAEYLLVDRRFVHRLPASVSLEWGALTEPLACVFHLLRLSPLPPSAKALVIGPGPMGYLAAVVLRALGQSVDVVGTDRDEKRLNVFAEAGFSVATSAKDSEYDVVFECSGSAGGVRSAIAAARRGGVIYQLGITSGDVALPFEQFVFKELRLQGGFCHNYLDWQAALQMMAEGCLELDGVITEIVPFSEWRRAFETLSEQGSMKILFRCFEED